LHVRKREEKKKTLPPAKITDFGAIGVITKGPLAGIEDANFNSGSSGLE
jgi:hypothetical protein